LDTEEEPETPEARHLRKLKSYEVGVTTLNEFYADRWNARDPYLMKLGIIGARFDPSSHTVDFEIGSNSTRDEEMGSAAEGSVKYQQGMYDNGVVGTYNSRTFGAGVCHVKFIDGVLASITMR
jgi:hypothetical protein